ncbi:MAG: DUF2087 domain-containing protein [Tumebacillaceae bacterium]
MEDISELFWNASVEEIKRGYVYQEDSEAYTCLVCGNSYERGVMYSDDGVYYEAEKFARVHLEKEHSSMFDYLISLEKKFTGLTDLQKSLLTYFHQGVSDREIVEQMDSGSTSTIRNHRFTLREKEKQAKVFLAIMGLLEGKSQAKTKFITVHKTATMVDERYAITEDENEEILQTYFKEGLDGPLSEFPKKQKRKLAILRHLIKRFDRKQKYTEAQVNEILKAAYHDYVWLRRYLIEYGFLDREADGNAYWVKVK